MIKAREPIHLRSIAHNIYKEQRVCSGRMKASGLRTRHSGEQGLAPETETAAPTLPRRTTFSAKAPRTRETFGSESHLIVTSAGAVVFTISRITSGNAPGPTTFLEPRQYEPLVD